MQTMLTFFFVNLVIKLSKNTGINKHAIKLVEDKQLFYEFNYSLSLIEQETLKVYIKIYLKTDLIWFFKSLIGVFILFDKKIDKNLQLYIDY